MRSFYRQICFLTRLVRSPHFSPQSTCPNLVSIWNFTKLDYSESMTRTIYASLFQGSTAATRHTMNGLSVIRIGISRSPTLQPHGKKSGPGSHCIAECDLIWAECKLSSHNRGVHGFAYYVTLARCASAEVSRTFLAKPTATGVIYLYKKRIRRDDGF